MQAECVRAQEAYTNLEEELSAQLEQTQQALEAAIATAASDAAAAAERWQAEHDKLAAARDEQKRDYEQAVALHERQLQEALAHDEAKAEEAQQRLEAAQALAEAERAKVSDMRAQLTAAHEATSAEKRARGDTEAQLMQARDHGVQLVQSTLNPEHNKLIASIAAILQQLQTSMMKSCRDS